MADTLTGDASLALPEFETPPGEPGGLLADWLRLAREREVREPLSAVLATATPDGIPSSRTVSLKEVTAEGVVFGSSASSRKGRELAANPRASVTLYWRELLLQLRLDGAVEVLDDAASDELFAARPPGARATTAVSAQSAPLDDIDRLRTAAARAVASGRPVPRPDDWHAFVLRPSAIEFWHGSPDRLHRRLRYERTASGWTATLLQP